MGDLGPEISFTYEVVNNKVSFEGQVNFENSFKWYFGDGSTNNGQKNPTHEYEDAGTYEVVLVAENEFAKDSIVSEVTVFKPLSTNRSTSIRIFPNPADDQLIIRSSITSEVGTVKLVNMHGQSVLSEALHLDEQQINISQQPPGVYYIMVLQGTELFQQQIIVR